VLIRDHLPSLLLREAVESLVREAGQDGCEIAQRLTLAGRDIRTGILGKHVQEHGAFLPLVEEDGPEATRAALARTRNPLLDEAETEPGIDQSALRPLDGVRENGVVDT
jgi:hypothetical protein